MKSQNSLIPRQVLFADPEKLMVKQSPNGQWLSYLAPHEGELNVWLAPVDDLEAALPITRGQQPIKEYAWSSQGDYVLYIHDEKGDENWQLHGFECKTGKHFCYTPKGANAKIIHQSTKKPDHLLIGLNQRDRHYHDVYLLDLKHNRYECLFENNQYWEFIADDDFTLRLGVKITAQGGEYIDLSDHKTVMANVTQHDLFGLYFYPRLRLGLSADSKTLYLAQSLESNTSILSQVQLTTALRTDLGGQAKADICDVLLEPGTKQPIAYAVNAARKEWFSLNPQTEKDLAFLKSYADGDIDITSQTQNNQQWLIAYVHDNGPVGYYLFERTMQTMRHLFDSHPAFKEYSFTKMQPHLIKTRDGLECVSYLSRPTETTQDKPVPLVLMVHGGPNFRDFWGFNPIHQWLSNRGYAVLSINYRASTGFGKAHAMAGNGEWGRKIQDDLLDGVNWAIEQGITTKDQVAIMGRSFGGYATLMALTQTPDVFCCGVDIVGPSNLETMAAHFPPYWKAMQGIINGMMLGCDPETAEGKAFLASRSPIHSVSKITKPLLIGHGSNDVRVLQEESDQLVKAMQENGIPVTYAYFPDEGHQFMHPGNRMAFYALAEAFLGRILQGKVELFSENIETSMVVEVDDFGLRE